jgi:hypothetical protein
VRLEEPERGKPEMFKIFKPSSKRLFFIFILQLYWDELVCGDVLRKCEFLKLAFIRKIKFEIIRSHHDFFLALP